MKTSDDMIGLHASDGERGPSMRLADGRRLFLGDPDLALMTPWVIAHSLSQLCRFTGHTYAHYSVAQHCIIVSQIVPPELALAGLMHDASEAFIGDLSRPLKVALDLASPGVVRGIEDRLHVAIAERYQFDFPHDPRIKDADNVAVATEIRDLLAPSPDPLYGLPDPLPEPIEPMTSTTARHKFLRRLFELGGR